MRFFVFFIYIIVSSFFNINVSYSIPKKTNSVDLAIIETDNEELKKQDEIKKQETIKKEKIAEQKRNKVENKQIKKETKKKYKQAKKQAKVAKINRNRKETTNIKARTKTEQIKNKKNEIKHNEKVVNAKRNASKEQKKVIKQAEQMTFIDDDAILEIIDNQVSPITYKKIRVSVKNKGVPLQCIQNNNKQKTLQQDSAEPQNSNIKKVDSNDVIQRKKGLKKHILKSLKANNISESLIDKIYDNLKELPSVEKSTTKFNKTSSVDFINNYNIPTRTKSGLVYKKLYKKDLQIVNDVFYVEPEAVLAIWAIETNYGNFIGKTNAFNALYSSALNSSTLARIDFFENNLIMLAKLVDYGYFDYNVNGSYAGALGGCQFMPDSFYRYAVSFDGGKADIINNNKDVFASIANYLYNTGWRQYQGVLTEVVIPDDFDVCLSGMNTTKTIEEWKKLGVKLNNSKIGASYFNNNDKVASLIITDINNDEIDFSDKRAFLVYDNFKVFLGYNPSINYGIVAGLFYDALSDKNQ